MATAQLPSAATQRAAAIRDGLSDIRRRTADLEAFATWGARRRRASLLDRILDQTFLSRRRPAPWARRPDRRTAMLAAAFGILAGIGIVAALAALVLRRRAQGAQGEPSGPEQETTIHLAGAQGAAKAGREPAADAEPSPKEDANDTEGSTASSFPASDPTPTAMTPGIGAG